jgi:hypothetical protein
MVNKEKLRLRFLRDPLPVRMGGLSATLARISSSARDSSQPELVSQLLDEAKHLIEWTAADALPEIAAELVQTQRLLTLWQEAWETASHYRSQRILLSVHAQAWSDRVLDDSGLI